MGLDNPIHLAFLLVILLLVFGAKRLPEMGRSLGSGLRGFKESINGTSTPTDHGRAPRRRRRPTARRAPSTGGVDLARRCRPLASPTSADATTTLTVVGHLDELRTRISSRCSWSRSRSASASGRTTGCCI